jgi:hypothetical protein
MSDTSSSTRRFNPYLTNILSADLKRMAGLWVKAGRLCKDECAAAICKGLADPKRVADALAKLKPPHRTALAFIQEAGGILAPDCLEAALVAAGHRPPGLRGYSRRSYPWSQDLIRRGIALTTDNYHPTSLDSYSSVKRHLFSDDRLLRHTLAPDIAVLDVKADLPVKDGLQRPPGNVVLDILAVIQAIGKTGGVGFTQAGMPRVSDMKKLRRELRWTDLMKVDGLPVPNLTEAVVTALRAVGLLEVSRSGLRLAEPPERFAARPRCEQVRPLVHGFANAVGWTESGWCGNGWDYWHHSGYPRMRHALLTALRALPPESSRFFALDRFDEALFDRVGEHASLNAHSPSPPYAYGASRAELEHKMEEWRRELRSKWRERERPWIESALRTWLFWLGVVELSLEDGAVRGFRLTDLGLEILHDAKPEQASAKPKRGSSGAWLVQPDFGLMVYIDKASPTQLVFAERIAERQGHAQRHVAHYILTRNSVYDALESGYTLDAILNELRKGAERTLPANVEAEMRGWSERREQVVVRRRAMLLEFAGEADRRAAMEAGVKGVEVGDRFLLVERGKSKASAPARKMAQDTVSYFDYTQPLPPCVEVRETGRLRLATPHPDLLIRGQLDIWAEPLGNDAWQLSEKSVQAAVKRNRSVEELVGLLDSRATRPVPPFLQLALKAWAGESFTAQLAKATVLRCAQPDAFHAIAGAKRHQGCLLGRLGPDTFLVDDGKVNELKQALRWAEIEIDGELTCRK